MVELTNKGLPHFQETGLRDVLESVTLTRKTFRAYERFEGFSCQTYIITVGTPLDHEGNARLDMIRSATTEVAGHMSDDALVILRSTVKIGTARDVVRPILTATGKRFKLAMCPERTLEGAALRELRELPQIIGADTQEERTAAAELFKTLTNKTVEVTSLEAAEIIKLVDNTSRDIRFAFANEVARLCEAFSVNAHEVIASGKLGYPRTEVALPGLVGGPCLEKDPHILAQSAATKGIDLEITRAARLVNERQPVETVGFLASLLTAHNVSPDAPITLLGLAFKGVPETDDLRGSMALKVLRALQAARPEAPITLYDPVIEARDLAAVDPGCHVATSLEAALKGARLVVISNNHSSFGQKALEFYFKHAHPEAWLYDYWSHFSHYSPPERYPRYLSLGHVAHAQGAHI